MATPEDCPYDSAMDRRANTINDHAVRISLLEQSMDRISNSLEAINGNINKLVWTVAVAIIGAVMKFVMSGGMS